MAKRLEVLMTQLTSHLKINNHASFRTLKPLYTSKVVYQIHPEASLVVYIKVDLMIVLINATDKHQISFVSI